MRFGCVTLNFPFKFPAEQYTWEEFCRQFNAPQQKIFTRLHIQIMKNSNSKNWKRRHNNKKNEFVLKAQDFPWFPELFPSLQAVKTVKIYIEICLQANKKNLLSSKFVQYFVANSFPENHSHNIKGSQLLSVWKIVYFKILFVLWRKWFFFACFIIVSAS